MIYLLKMGIFSLVSIWIPYIHGSHLGDGHVDFLVVFGYPKMIEFARLIGDAPNEGILGDELFPAVRFIWQWEVAIYV